MLGTLFVGAFCWPLWSKTTAFQVVHNRSRWQILTIEVLDHQANRVMDPERKRQLELIWSLVHQPFLDFGVLFAGQFPLVAMAVAALSRFDGIKPATFVLFSDGTDVGLAEINDFGNGRVCGVRTALVD